MQSDLSTAHDPTDTGPAAPVASVTSSEMEDFIYLISHDVRGSVRALLELPQWIKEDLEESGVRINSQVAASIDLMNRHTGRLDRMLVDLLTYSRIGRLQKLASQSLNGALQEVLDEMTLPVGFTLRHEFGCTAVYMGERDLPVLLKSLISNGIKHHDRSTGEILVQSRREGEDVVISVSDDGPGIEERFHDRIFAPMTTLRPRDEVEGSGMGLAMVRKIADIHGGSARVLPSPLGRGTCVEVRVRSPQSH